MSTVGFYFIKKVEVNMEQLIFKFEESLENGFGFSPDTLIRKSICKMETLDLLTLRFQEKVKSMLDNPNVDCSMQYLNHRIQFHFTFNTGKHKKSCFFLASEKILNADDYEVSLLLEYVMKRKVNNRSRLKEVIRKFAFYPKCRSHQTSFYVQGKVYDLHRIFNELNNSYLFGKLDNPLFWRKPTVRMKNYGQSLTVLKNRVRSLKLGTYCLRCNTIFISSILDNVQVPPLVVEAIVFHEMVHSYVFNYVSHSANPHGFEFKSLYSKLPQAKMVKKLLASTEFFEKLKEIYLENIV